MDFAGIIVGAAIGVGGMIAKEKLFDSKANASSQSAKKEADILSDENEKLRKRIKEAERQIEDLMAENQKLRRQYKEKDEDHDDLEDELDKTKAEVKNLRTQNEELMRKINEYKLACDSYENEIAQLKQH